MTQAPTAAETETPQDESRFLAQLEADPPPGEALAAYVRGLGAEGNLKEAAEAAEVALETLAAGERTDAGLEVLAALAEALAGDPKATARIEDWARKLLVRDKDRRPLLEPAGIGQGLAPEEFMRRFMFLGQLAPGRLCRDRTWGFGEVRRVDTFYQQAEIDFVRKPYHEVALAHLAQSLELIDDDHLLALRYRDRDKLEEMIRNDPAEVVRRALLNFGPMTPAQLEETLVPEIIEAGQWKGFWDRARKALKNDPLVETPTRRSLPLHLREAPKAYDDAWFARLAKVRDPEEILHLIREWRAEGSGELPSAKARKHLANRVEFLRVAAGAADPVLLARTALAVDGVDLEDETLVDGLWTPLLDPTSLTSLASGLSARDFRTLLARLGERRGDELAVDLLQALPTAAPSLFNEAMDALKAAGRESQAAAALRALMQQRAATVSALAWILKRPDRVEAWNLAPYAQVYAQMVSALEADHAGEWLRASHQVREGLASREWIARVFERSSAAERKELFQKVQNSTAFDTLDRRSVMGQMIKADPQLQSEVAATVTENEAARAQARVTSQRSYEERRRQLEKLVQEEIPANSRDIAVARSYGDLRENSEFKSAKEMQAVLMRRQEELQTMLKQVRPTDFAGVSSRTVIPGMAVRLRRAGAAQDETYHVLGEWDRDEDLHIIASTTRLAQALMGRKAGEVVRVPGEHGDEDAVIETVTALPEPVRAWILGR